MRKKTLVLVSTNLVFDYDAFFLSIHNQHKWLGSNDAPSTWKHVTDTLHTKKELLKPRSYSVSLLEQLRLRSEICLQFSSEVLAPSLFVSRFGEAVHFASVAKLLKDNSAHDFGKMFVLDNSAKDFEAFAAESAAPSPKLEWIHIRNPYQSTTPTSQSAVRLRIFETLRQLATHPDFSFLEFPEERQRVEFAAPFDSQELEFWHAVDPLHPPLVFRDREIVHGKGVGRQLGIPTANLLVEADFLKHHLVLPGIYHGSLKFLSVSNEEMADAKGRIFQAIVSIGFNPQYSQKTPVVEAMILEDFNGREFYGSHVELTLTHLSRPEAKFGSFAEFIFAMSNDVESLKRKLAASSSQSN